ncbi:MAG: CoA transferase [Spongiibacteraceae bacterium]
MKQLLDGVRVVEVAIYAFVPSAAAVLADWGAEVIKIEHPETADPVRGLASYGIAPGDGGVTALWEVFNRGKQSIAIDIASPQGLEVLMELVDKADIFLTNFMQPARARLGIDVDQIMARNPRIIYGRGTGHGPVGPDANKGGFDAVSYWSRAGAGISAKAPADAYPALMPGPGFGDVQAGMHLAGGVAAALYQRERTGQGSVVDVSLLGSGLWAMQASIAGCYATKSDNIVQLDRSNPPNPVANIYKTQDERFFILGMLESDRYWAGLCEALGRPELATNPLYLNNKTRAENSASCVKELESIFESLTFEKLTSVLNSQEGQWAEVKAPGNALNDEQAMINGYLKYVDYENGAKLPLVPVPVRINEQEAVLRRAPEHAEHTDQILIALGRTEEEILELKITGAIS